MDVNTSDDKASRYGRTATVADCKPYLMVYAFVAVGCKGQALTIKWQIYLPLTDENYRLEKPHVSHLVRRAKRGVLVAVGYPYHG